MEEQLKQIRKEVGESLAEGGERDTANGKEVEIRNTRRMLIDEVVPGMILAEDIYGNDRALLVASGTKLSRGLIGRLKEIAAESGEEVRLWVGES
jgi:hypothetical protein